MGGYMDVDVCKVEKWARKAVGYTTDDHQVTTMLRDMSCWDRSRRELRDLMANSQCDVHMYLSSVRYVHFNPVWL
jgi:hypothetical protein